MMRLPFTFTTRSLPDTSSLLDFSRAFSRFAFPPSFGNPVSTFLGSEVEPLVVGVSLVEVVDALSVMEKHLERDLELGNVSATAQSYCGLP